MMAPDETGDEAEAVRRARGCIGVRFVPQGRSIARGLDCVGLIAEAYAGRLAGRVPDDYPQRGGRLGDVIALIEQTGLRRTRDGGARAGDVLLLAAGPGQWHLAIRSALGLIHADARLRRVVETPGEPAWPIIGAWRIVNGEG